MPTLLAWKRRYASSMLSASPGRRPKTSVSDVVREVGPDGPAGRGGGDEVERAAEPDALLGQAGGRLLERVGRRCSCRSRRAGSRRRRRGGRLGPRRRQSTGLSGQARVATVVSPWPSADQRLEQLRAPRRPGRPEPAAGPDARDQRARSSTRRSFARWHAQAYTAGARYVDVLYSDQHVRRAHIEYAADEDLGYSPPWLVDALPDARRDGRRALRDHRQPGARAVRRPRRRARRQGAHEARSPRRRWRSPTASATGRSFAYPNEGWARDGLRRARRRAALAGGRDRRPPRRARSGRRLARAHRRAPAARRSPERAAVRRASLPRPRHRPDDRPASGVAVAGGARRSRRASSTSRTCRPKRCSRPPTHAASKAPSARRCRCRSRATSSAASRCASKAGRRSRCAPSRARRSCAPTSRPTTAPRGSARSRSSTATPASAQTGLVFYDTLFDENASSHIALGASIVQAVPGRPSSTPEERHERGVNHSSIHTDFMIGSNELEIDGVDEDGTEIADPAERRLAALSPAGQFVERLFRVEPHEDRDVWGLPRTRGRDKA